MRRSVEPRRITFAKRLKTNSNYLYACGLFRETVYGQLLHVDGEALGVAAVHRGIFGEVPYPYKVVAAVVKADIDQIEVAFTV